MAVENPVARKRQMNIYLLIYLSTLLWATIAYRGQWFIFILGLVPG
jgi:hypothetical protein